MNRSTNNNRTNDNISIIRRHKASKFEKKKSKKEDYVEKPSKKSKTNKVAEKISDQLMANMYKKIGKLSRDSKVEQSIRRQAENISGGAEMKGMFKNML